MAHDFLRLARRKEGAIPLRIVTDEQQRQMQKRQASESHFESKLELTGKYNKRLTSHR